MTISITRLFFSLPILCLLSCSSQRDVSQPPAQTRPLNYEAVPNGFRIMEDGRISVTKQIVQQMNREVTSSNRMDYIQHYVRMLSSEDATNRMFAIYSLGKFQSPKSFEALFSQAKIETDPQMICKIADSLNCLFAYWDFLTDSGDKDYSEKWDCQAGVKLWAKYYEQLGYLGIFEANYAKLKGNLESEGIYVVGYASCSSPDLLPFFQSVSKQTSFPEIRDVCREAIDCLSKRK